MSIGALEIQLLADVARLRQDMQKATGIVGDAAGGMTRAFAGVKSALAGLGLGLSVAGLSAWVKGAIDAADETSKLAQKMGVATKDVAGLQLAFELSGASSQLMTTSIARLSKEMAAGNDAFKRMGIDVKNADGTLRSTRDVLADVAERFAGYSDGAGKAALAQELFGKTGAEMIPLLNAGAEGLAEMDRMAEQLGLTVDENTARSAEQFNDTLSLLGKGLSGIATQVAAQLLPTLTSLAGQFLSTMTEGDKLKTIGEGVATMFKGLYVVGLTTVEVFKTLGTSLGAVAASFAAVLRGDFRGALDVLRDLKADIGTGWVQTLEQAKAAWNGTGHAAVETMAKITATAPAATEQTRKLARAAREVNAALKEKQLLAARALKELAAYEKAEAEIEEQLRKTAQAEKELQAARALKAMAAYDDAEAAADAAYRAALEVDRKAREQMEADWQRTADQMSQSLTDALMTGGKNVAEYLKGLFRTLVLRPVIQAVMAPVTAMFAPSASAAGGAGSMGSMAGVLNGFGQLLNGNLIGSQLAFPVASSAHSLGASQGLADLLGTGAGMLGNAAAGYGISRALSGGYSAGGWVDVAAAIASAIPGIGPIAGVIGGLVNRAFGRKLADLGIEGDIGAEGFTGSQYRFEKGGWFRSDRTKRSPLDAEAESGLDAAVSALYTSTAAAADALGLNSAAVTAYTESLKLSTKGLTDEQVQAKLYEFMAQLGETLAQQVGLSAERLGTLAAALTTVNDILGTFDQRLLQVSVAGGEAAEQLAALFGGVDNLGGALALYAEQFTFAGDSAAYTLDMAAKALQQVGLAVPATRAEFMRLVESQDLMTDAGRRAYAALLGVAGGLDGLYDAAEAAAKSTTDLAAANEQRLFDEQRQWQDWAKDIASTARTVRDAWRDVVKGVEAAIKKLRGDIVGDNAAAVRAQYASTLQAARGGDRAAIEALPALAQQLSRIGEGTARSAYELSRLRGTLAADLESVINAARGSSAARSDDMLSMLGRLQWIRVDPATGSYLLGAGGGGGGFSIGGAPGFASGGLHSGGWRVVGERGPELEATGPSRIHTGDQLGQAMGVDELRDEVRGMRQEMVSMQHAVVRNTSRMAKLLERVIPEGDALQVRTAT